MGPSPLVIAGADVPNAIELVSLRKIWDQGPHSAFGDLIRFRGNWFCTFREASRHHLFDGSVRVIRSDDGETWTSAALITDAAADLRDPKFSVTPGGQLMIDGLQRFPADQKRPHQSLVWFSPMGVHVQYCVLGRPFSLRQMVRLGKNVALCRDLTDALYNPLTPQYFSHERGTELAVEKVEKYWCHSITSADLVRVVPGSANSGAKPEPAGAPR